MCEQPANWLCVLTRDWWQNSNRDRWSKNGSSYLPQPSARDAALPQGCLDVMCACTWARGASSLLYLYKLLLISGCKPCWLERGCLFCCTVPGMVVSNRGTAATAGNGKCFIPPVKAASECESTLLGSVLLGTTFLALSIMLCWSQRVKYKSTEHLKRY